MKPEDTDRFIRQQIEELDFVPELEWNETRAWRKIRFRLKYGWLLKGLYGAVFMGLTAGYLLWPQEQKPVTQALPTEKVKVPEVVVRQTDSVRTDSVSKELHVHDYKQAHDKKRTFAGKRKSILEPRRLDTKPQSFYYAFDARANMSEALMNPIDTLRQVNLRMPHLHMVQMNVSNTFNAKNLIQSLEISNDENTYYRYQYNSRYIPGPYNNFYMKPQAQP